MIKVAEGISVQEQAPLDPGIYALSRGISFKGGLATLPVYKHQFIVAVPKKPEQFGSSVQQLGPSRGIVLGAYNIKDPELGRVLRYRMNRRMDINAAKEKLRGAMGGGKYRTTDPIPVMQGGNVDKKIQEMMDRAAAWRAATRKEPVMYPGLAKNMLYKGKNSNTFVQSLLQASKLTDKPVQAGLATPGADLTFDLKDFEP